MKKILLSLPVMLMSLNGQAKDLSVSDISYIEHIKQAVLNTERESIRATLLDQANHAITIAGEAQDFLKRNQSGIDLHDFTKLYSEAMKSGELHQFKKAVIEHSGKSILQAAIKQYKNKDHGCELNLDVYGEKVGQAFKKISITCIPTVYGMGHWVPVTQKITDTYYISDSSGEKTLEHVEFGLLKGYSQSIENLLKEIKRSLDEEFI
ncbi:hypothetical protein [Photobacterium galatheae]|uniref:Toluene tolerance protein n=1 Tax=Photobacterium galatheae TaxID=1654360 RepID=A0A066RU76_9GAMM|nr:hypothetical protein [Photobacterium galatheae]KDM90943.1 hypothetical protein EA58_14400 [Photobacterium galatheae]MCM0149093.1 hypothetical protein [Photobacterium galatheae]